MKIRSARYLVGLALAASLVACSSTTSTDGTGSAANTTSGSGTAAASGTITVLAAASLTEGLNAIIADYTAANPGVKVNVSYAASSTIVQQVNQGAPADLIALAGESAAKPLTQSLVKATTNIATNSLEIAVPPANPGQVTSLADLAKPNLKVVLCASPVPCGAAADATLKAANVTANVVSRETDVKATLTKVRLGEADAAIVYHSDVVSAKGAVTGIVIDPSVNQILRYPLITVSDSAIAPAFAAYVAGPGVAKLEAAGFQAP